MKIGDTIESSIWVTGEEPPEMIERYESDVTEAMDYFCFENKLTHGTVTFTRKHPMDDGVPEVPDHIQGERVRLLVGESEILGEAVETTEGSFVNNLEVKDLKQLRNVIRRYRVLSDQECDQMIEQLGPEAALDALRQTH